MSRGVRVRVAAAVQILGLVAISVGAFLLSPALGFIVTGVGLVILGVALEDDR